MKTAKNIAKHGRYGDNTLLHVSNTEIKGLEALAGRPLPRNPKTGLKEAFFFLPFLAPLAGAAGAAAAPALAAATAAPAIAGAGMGALGAGTAAATGALTAGMNAAASAAPALAASAPATVGGLTALAPAATEMAATTAAPLATTAAGLGPAGTMAGATLPEVAAGAAPVAAESAIAPTVAAGAEGLAAPGYMAGDAALGASGQGALGGVGGMLGNMDLSQLGMLAYMMQGMGGGGGGDDEEKDVSGIKYEGGEATAPPDDYEPGIDPEWNYFQNSSYLYKNGGLVKGYADGGLAAMAPKGGPSDDQLVSATVDAITNGGPNAQQIIQMFVQTFGEAALQDLVARIQQTGGGQDDQGHGRSDSIPAKLSEGEFVLPADVVSGLGNGSTEAGASQLYDMMNNVRGARGQMGTPPTINPKQMMPV